MTRPVVRIYTAPEVFIDREMNDDEFAVYKRDLKEYEKEQAKAEAKATSRQVLLDRLGITADEAKLLLG
jgi:hypothetical protein